jgi:outer membrane protein OmpA-like peptidoglycan-associated protein
MFKTSIKTSVQKSIVCALIAAFGFTGPALAVDIKYYPPGSKLQPIEVARMLAGPQFKPTLKMRGVQIVGGAQAMPAESISPSPDQPQPIMFAQASMPAAAVASAAPAAAATQASPAAQISQPFAISVPFAFNSAKLAPDAFEALDNIAEGIKLVQLPGDLIIEGHTDAKGGDAYNLKLSVRRAAAVKRYFAQHHNIAANKLKAVGKGRAEPLNGKDPLAPENRRVQFRLA